MANEMRQYELRSGEYGCDVQQVKKEGISTTAVDLDTFLLQRVVSPAEGSDNVGKIEDLGRAHDTCTPKRCPVRYSPLESSVCVNESFGGCGA